MFVALSSEQARFASWLAEQLAPTILGSKPATLLTFCDLTDQPLLTWWKTYGSDIFSDSRMSTRVMFSCPYRQTVLFYQAPLLEKCLSQNGVQSFLASRGYDVSAGIRSLLDQFVVRCHGSFPHEIGVLLGIPLKDVKGFMGLSESPLACRGSWCIYGNPRPSLERMRQQRQDGLRIGGLLRAGACPVSLLTKNPIPALRLFSAQSA